MVVYDQQEQRYNVRSIDGLALAQGDSGKGKRQRQREGLPARMRQIAIAVTCSETTMRRAKSQVCNPTPVYALAIRLACLPAFGPNGVPQL